MLKNLFLVSLCFLSFKALAQDDMISVLDSLDQLADRRGFVGGTFKGTRVVNGHSVETRAASDLDFIISHRFGTVNKGIYDLFGLDQATIRFGLDYGVTDRFTVGVGRSSLEKTYDGFLKYKLLRQTEKNGKMPLTLVLFSSIAMNTTRFNQSEEWRGESSRLSYTYQLLIARKFSERFSLQVSPTLVHRNFVESKQDENDVYSTGFAGRFKLTKRVAITGEYFYVFPGETADNFKNAFSVGFDIETGGHIFQLHFTNSQGMIEKFFIPETTGSWSKKEVYIGFNISRIFTLRDKDKEGRPKP